MTKLAMRSLVSPIKVPMTSTFVAKHFIPQKVTEGKRETSINNLCCIQQGFIYFIQSFTCSLKGN